MKTVKEIKSYAPKLLFLLSLREDRGNWYVTKEISKRVAGLVFVFGFRAIVAVLSKSSSLQRLLPVHLVSSDPSYQVWLIKNHPSLKHFERMTKEKGSLSYQPKISVIMPVYNTPVTFLREAIESVRDQIYPNWELCIADDASPNPNIRKMLGEFTAKDDRIKVIFREENGHISRASNSALELVEGEYIALLDHDDVLEPHALLENVRLLNKHPNADMIYSDEDKVGEDNKVKQPFFKPDWCPDSFLSRMYICHLGVYRYSLIKEIGGFRPGFEGAQDYDLVLRFTEKTDNIHHISGILYHWRMHAESTAKGGDEIKSYAYIAGERALNEAIERRGEPGYVESVPGQLGLYQVRYNIKDPQKVSVIIPMQDHVEETQICLDSIFSKTTYKNFEVILVDNGSKESATFEMIRLWAEKEPERFRCHTFDIPFNYSKINNFGLSKATGNYLLFLNNGTEILTDDWMGALVEQAQRPSIGAVGGLLLYPNGFIKHAGLILGIRGGVGHSYRNKPVYDNGYFGQLVTINNYSAVAAACLMCRRDVFEEVGGFEEKLERNYNDVDLCLKMVESGYRNVCLPHVKLYQHEFISQGTDQSLEEKEQFVFEYEYLRDTWAKYIKNDPCYSPHLTRKADDYRVRLERY